MWPFSLTSSAFRRLGFRVVVVATATYGVFQILRRYGNHLRSWLFNISYQYSRYDYSHLPNAKSIRLLKLGDRSKFGLVTCNLHITPIDQAPPYVALSYTWGPALITDNADNIAGKTPPGPFAVHCGKDILQVTESLARCLDFLAHNNRTEWLWIDAICIDQNNSQEREFQIELMGDIYAKAERVLVWLGEEDPEFQDVFWLFDEFVTSLLAFSEKHGEDVLYQQSPFDPAFLTELGINKTVYEMVTIWNHYVDFFQHRRWFSRAWVFQEMALARKVEILIGRTYVSWSRMEYLGNTFANAKWLFQMPIPKRELQSMRTLGAAVLFPDTDSRSINAHLAQLLANLSNNGSEQEKWYLLLYWLVGWTRSLTASDARDKIFCVLGLARRLLPPGMDLPIRPEYDQSIIDVYVSFSKIMICGVPNLLLLSLKEDSEVSNILGLPSWVPDLSINTRIALPLPLIASGLAYNATLARESEPCTCVVEDGILLMNGVTLDTVVYTSDGTDILAPDNTFPVLELISLLEPVYKATGQPRVEAVWRTIIGNAGSDTAPDYYPASPDLGIGFHDLIRLNLSGELLSMENTGKDTTSFSSKLELLDVLQNVEGHSNELPTKKDILEFTASMQRKIHEIQSKVEEGLVQDKSFTPLLEMEGKQTTYSNATGLIINERRIYRTSQGYIGLCPLSTREGDEIVFIQGALVPFVLRRRAGTDKYELVGETYIHGFMNGEIMTPEFKSRIRPLYIS